MGMQTPAGIYELKLIQFSDIILCTVLIGTNSIYL
jgi:hypothetical protein